MKLLAALMLLVVPAFAHASLVDTSTGTFSFTSTTKDLHTPDGWIFSSFRTMPASQLPDGLYVGSRSGIARPGGWLMISRADGALFDLNALAVYDHYQFACGQNFCGLDFMSISVDTGDTFSWRMDGIPSTLDRIAFSDRFNGISQLTLGLTGEGWLLSSIDLSPVPLPPSAASMLLAVAALVCFGSRNKVDKRFAA